MVIPQTKGITTDILEKLFPRSLKTRNGTKERKRRH